MRPEIEHAVHPTNSSTPTISMMMMNTSSNNALFGKYEVGRLLGCGAFAKVYHARNILTGQSVAIKMINKKKVTGTALASNIKREISIMRRLRHPNIVKLHEVMATRSKIYFVLELVKGGELFSRVAKGRFSEDLSRKYFQQLISAIGYCHSRGVYHRDLKPENLLVDENGDLKVSDFGLSAIKDRNYQQQQQQQQQQLLQTLCGTPAYVAPEILTKRGYDGAKVDIWSCGVILFVLNAGFLPFNDPNLMNMYKKIYKGEYRCPKWFSSDLKRFLSRLLETNPANRITVDEMIKDPWFIKGGGLKFYREVSFYKYDKYWGSEEDNNNNNMELTLASSSASSSNNTDINSNLVGGGGGDPLNIQREDGSNVINSNSSTMNAFDIISFSSGLDLSGLFDQASNPMQDAERFFSAESPEIIMNRIQTVVENLASSSSSGAAASTSSSAAAATTDADAPPVRDREEKLSTRRVRKKKEVELAGSIDLASPIGGMSVAKVEIKRLTEQLVVVEVKREAGAGDGLSISSSCYNDIWKMVRSHLDDLVYQQHQVV